MRFNRAGNLTELAPGEALTALRRDLAAFHAPLRPFLPVIALDARGEHLADAHQHPQPCHQTRGLQVAAPKKQDSESRRAGRPMGPHSKREGLS